MLGEIVRGRNTGRRDEFEVVLSVLTKPLGDVLGLGASRCTLADPQDLGSRFLQPSLKLLRCHALSTVNDPEQRPDLLQKAICEVLRNRVQLEEKLDVANQVREAARGG